MRKISQEELVKSSFTYYITQKWLRERRRLRFNTLNIKMFEFQSTFCCRRVVRGEA